MTDGDGQSDGSLAGQGPRDSLAGGTPRGVTDGDGSADYGVDVLAFGPHPDDVELFCDGTEAHAFESLS